MRFVTVHCTWKSTTDVEIPDEIPDEDVPDEIGSLQQWFAEQLDTATAELTDWDIGGPIKEER